MHCTLNNHSHISSYDDYDVLLVAPTLLHNFMGVQKTFCNGTLLNYASQFRSTRPINKFEPLLRAQSGTIVTAMSHS